MMYYKLALDGGLHIHTYFKVNLEYSEHVMLIHLDCPNYRGFSPPRQELDIICTT